MSLMMSPKGAKSAILQAQESSEVVGDQSHKGGYRRVSTLGHGNGNVQLRDALRPEHKLQSVDKHKLRKKKIAKLVRRSSLGLVDMKPIRPINIPLTARGTKGLMLLGSNWAGV